MDGEIPDTAEAFDRLNRLATTVFPTNDSNSLVLTAKNGRGRGNLYLNRGRGGGRGGRSRFHCLYCAI